MMRKLLVLCVVVMMAAAACGDSGDSGSGNVLTQNQGNSSDGGSDGDGGSGGDGGSDNNDSDGDDDGGISLGSGDFCQTALDLDGSDAFGDFSTLSFSAEFFDMVDSAMAQVQSQAPNDQVSDDIGVFRAEFAQLGDILAEFDYDITNPGVFTSLGDFDTTAMDAASDRLNLYLEENCGFNLGDSSDSSDGGSLTDPGAADELADGFEAIGENPELVEQLVAAFGIDLETAECLSEEFEDLDLDSPDPSILTLEVCGTTLLEVITNLGGG